MAWLASDTRQTNRHPKKPNQPRAETARAHPLVDPGNPSNSAKTQATTHRPRLCYCMVAMATCPPGRRPKGAHQAKITTVVLESVRKVHEGLQSRLSIRRIDARRRKARAL